MRTAVSHRRCVKRIVAATQYARLPWVARRIARAKYGMDKGVEAFLVKAFRDHISTISYCFYKTR